MPNSITAEGCFGTSPTWSQCRAQEIKTGVDFALKRGGSITGSVVDGSTGTLIQGKDVRAELDGFSLAWTSTDWDESYALLAIPDGRIEVIVGGQGSWNSVRPLP